MEKMIVTGANASVGRVRGAALPIFGVELRPRLSASFAAAPTPAPVLDVFVARPE
ncbi:hypothetical protein ACQBAT_11335 [Ornithinimicrobium sp. Y1847]|uniref:hypothetical protein n=1 Tax=unclassified Ornithinimicrobium TaxID=2615080 RepID=UPI003B66BCE2